MLRSLSKYLFTRIPFMAEQDFASTFIRIIFYKQLSKSL